MCDIIALLVLILYSLWQQDITINLLVSGTTRGLLVA